MSQSKESIRLQKFIADQGICSRRQAESLIEQGDVMVNGEVAHLGQKIIPSEAKVMVNGRSVTHRQTKTLVLVMNKPKGYICSHSDPYHDKTIYELVPPPWNKERLICAGRLDKESEGLLILTNDGALSQRITHPSEGVTKRYHVTLSKDFQTVHIHKLLEGFEDEGEFLRAEKVIPATKIEQAERKLEIHLQHGRKREIRRMLEALGYWVKRLQRVQIGGIKLRGLSPGRCRKLSIKEIDLLFK